MGLGPRDGVAALASGSGVDGAARTGEALSTPRMRPLIAGARVASDFESEAIDLIPARGRRGQEAGPR